MNRSKDWMSPALALALVPCLGCLIYVRDEEHLFDETVELIDGQRAQVEACYAKVLSDAQVDLEDAEREAQGPYADIGAAVKAGVNGHAGQVVVRFRVEKKTGAFSKPRVDAARTTASEPVQACVLNSLEGLHIDPPDSRNAEIAYLWHFDVGKPGKDRPAVTTAPGDTGQAADGRPAAPEASQASATDGDSRSPSQTPNVASEPGSAGATRPAGAGD